MKKLLLLFVIILLPIAANAYDALIDGVYYNLNKTTKTAEVTYRYFSSKNQSAYSGHVIIPEKVSYRGDSYTVTSISNSAFGLCSDLTSVTIPSTVTMIDVYAFGGCSKLNYVSIPNSVTSIGESAFSETGWYNSQPDGILYLDNWLIRYKGEKPIGNLEIVEGTRGIADQAFCNCSGLTYLAIPNSVKNIGGLAFYNCSGLTSVIIGNSVRDIGYQAFYGCSSLTSVTIPNSVTSIGGWAFCGCSYMTSVTIPNGVASIGECAFALCSSLSSVIIPNSVTNIEEQTFADCSSLISVSIPNSVTNIGNSAFGGCCSLTKLNIPNSVTSIGDYAFRGCNSITSVTIPDNLTSIGDGVFRGCSSLTSVAIPNSVTNLGQEAFAGCSRITSVSIPNSVKTIGESAFQNCSGMEMLELPSGLQIIKKATFKGCYNLTSVTIPATVEFIYQEAFANCNALENVKTKPATPPFLYDNSFSNYSIPLEVPKGCKEDYHAAQGWMNFTNIFESDKGYYKLIYLVENNEYKSYKIEEGSSVTPEPAPSKEGYTFSGWSEIPKTMPAHDVTVTGTFSINSYKLTYMVDGEDYKSTDVEYDTAITPETSPSKEGYTFSGWSEIPKTMPAHDVTVTGTFSINSYKLTYMVDGEDYKSTDVEYDTVITPETSPSKEGYTFSGWSEIPKTMPAHDVTVTGTFSINSYKLTYMVDGEDYKSTDVEYDTVITPETSPSKEGYTFSGWSEIPKTMPAHDVTVTGTFIINSYKLTYMVDGEDYKSTDVEYDTAITPETSPSKEGYTFSGWSEIPKTMPAHDVTVTGTFSINSYKLTYMVDDEEYKSTDVEYDTAITPETAPSKEGYTFSGWSEIPKTMPAHDVTVTGTFNINSYKLTYMVDGEVYKEIIYEYGTTITPEPHPEGDYVTFEWTDLPQTMPAYDVVVHASYTTGIIEAQMATQRNLRLYSPNGKKLKKLQKGLNIVVLDDGTVKKVVMK